MKFTKIIQAIFISIFCVSCAGVGSNRTFLEQMDNMEDGLFVPSRDFRVASGDSGKAHRTQEELMERTPMDEEEAATRLYDKRLNKEFNKLYNAQSDFARRHYHRYEGYFSNISEKIYFMRLDNLSERNQYLSSRGAPIGRNLGMNGMNYRSISSTVAMGMSKDEVIRAWGRPSRIDVAGNPKYENERWAFYERGRIKYVYFESGRVQGWQIP